MRTLRLAPNKRIKLAHVSETLASAAIVRRLCATTLGGVRGRVDATVSASQLWADFLASDTAKARAAQTSTYSSWQFGYGVEQGNRLLDCVLNGPKRATAGALRVNEAEGEPIPTPGDHSVILDGYGIARCIIRAAQVDIVPFDEVDDRFAYDEGEGDRSLAHWRDVHWNYFSRELAELGRRATHDLPVVCERFEVVYPTRPTEPPT